MSKVGPIRVSARSPAELLATVPYLLGYHPAEGQLVLLGLSGSRLAISAVTMPRSHLEEDTAVLHATTTVMSREGVNAVLAIGYGQADIIDPVLATVGQLLGEHCIPLRDAIRVSDGRYYCVLCTDSDCCSPAGIPFDPTVTEVAARLTVAGLVATPDRSDIAARLAPVEGVERHAIREATARAQHHMDQLLASVDNPAEVVRAAGRAALAVAVHRYRAGGRLSHDEIAWLTLLLTHIPVRDDAARGTTADSEDQRLWTDLTRQAEPHLAAAPASLLALAAWRSGDGTLANIAVDRALASDPQYRLAHLIAQALFHAVPPPALSDGWLDQPPGANDGRTGGNHTS